MIFEQIAIGGDRNFAYLIGCQQQCVAAVVDPSYSTETVLGRASELGLAVKYVINTHGHYDHTGGNQAVVSQTGAQIVGGPGSGADIEMGDGDHLDIGSVTLRFIHTPGHTSDGVCVLVGSHVCTGDTLFVGKVGGTDFGVGARAEYDSLHDKLMTLPDDTQVWPGHDYGGRPHSTIGEEKKQNPFLLQPSFEAFVDLKRNWTRYKKEHGIQ